MTEQEEWEETHARLARIREYIAECEAIVDEMFPEAEEKRKVGPQLTCELCGWPFARIVNPEECVKHENHKRTVGWRRP